MHLLPEDCETCHPIGAVHICLVSGGRANGMSVAEVVRDLRVVGADDPEMVQTARYATHADVGALLDELVRDGCASTWTAHGVARYRIDGWYDDEGVS